jgi:hypothetical protein
MRLTQIISVYCNIISPDPVSLLLGITSRIEEKFGLVLFTSPDSSVLKILMLVPRNVKS